MQVLTSLLYLNRYSISKLSIPELLETSTTKVSIIVHNILQMYSGVRSGRRQHWLPARGYIDYNIPATVLRSYTIDLYSDYYKIYDDILHQVHKAYVNTIDKLSWYLTTSYIHDLSLFQVEKWVVLEGPHHRCSDTWRQLAIDKGTSETHPHTHIVTPCALLGLVPKWMEHVGR
jgi:hypothetical protein